MPTPLDRVDRLLLEALQSDARLTLAELAEKVSLSPSPCWRRVKRLEEAGLIQGYQAVLSPQAVGWGVTAFVAVMLENHTTDRSEAFELAVADIPEVIACHNISGRYDYQLEVVAEDLEAFGELARNRLRRLPGVKEIYSSFALRTVKPRRALPLPGAGHS